MSNENTVFYDKGSVRKKLSEKIEGLSFSENKEYVNLFNELFVNENIDKNNWFTENIFILSKNIIELIKKHSKVEMDFQTEKIVFALINLILYFDKKGSTLYPLYPLEELKKDLLLLGFNKEFCNEVVGNLDLNKLPEIFFGSFSEKAKFPFIIENEKVYIQKSFLSEKFLVNEIQKRLYCESNIDLNGDLINISVNALNKVINHASDASIILDDIQKLAVFLSYPVNTLFISGGPGTGKTTIVKYIIKFLTETKYIDKEKLNAEIVLTAPTGRAANRLLESIKEKKSDGLYSDIQSMTMHRLLGFSPYTETFKYHEKNKLNYKAVILDEASMVDIFLFTKLIKALKEDTKLVVLGDAAQLPSVDAGAVFRDLVEDNCYYDKKVIDIFNEKISAQNVGLNNFNKNKENVLKNRIVILKENYRQKGSTGGKEIVDFADVIKDSDDEINFKFKKNIEYNKDGSFFNLNGVHLEKAENLNYNDMEVFVNKWVKTFYNNEKFKCLKTQIFTSANGIIDDCKELEYIDEFLKSGKILCTTNYGIIGISTVNGICNGILNNNFKFQPGTPIIVLKNKYSIGKDFDLYNGDQGIVLKVKIGDKTENRGVFKIGDEYKSVNLSLFGVNEIDYAYAITVHKSQGSEFNNVAFILPQRENEMLKKEIIYTAVTRAKEAIIIFGDEAVLRNGIKTRIKRYTSIKEKLKQ